MLFLMKNIKLHQNISTLAAFFVQALEKANDVPPDLTRISRDFDRLSHLVQLTLRFKKLFPIPSFSSSFSTSSFPASPSSVAQAEVPRPSPFVRVILYWRFRLQLCPFGKLQAIYAKQSHSATRNCCSRTIRKLRGDLRLYVGTK
jgi:hypothetical protein